MTERFLDGDLNYSKKFDSNKFEQYRGKYDKRFAEFRFDLALEAVWSLVQDLNKYVDTNKPWELAKTDPEKLPEVLGYLVAGVRTVGELLQPFLPGTAGKICETLGGAKTKPLDGVLFPKKG
jgi:methionyl-tRNA synthetase